MKKCKYYIFYKALSPPSCGCDYCERKWANACKIKKKKMAISGDCPDPEACEEGCIGYCTDTDDLTEDVYDYITRNTK